jgi:S1-C subfamily serine protease
LQAQVSDLTRALAGLNIQPNITYTDIYANIRDSVVTVRSIISLTSDNSSTVQGSGFIYTYDGKYIVVTNNHVVEGATSIAISLESGDAYSAQTSGRDPFSDLAILSVDAPSSILKPLVVASSSSLRVGQLVMAVGTPYGLTGSLTTGVISQLGRSISETASGGYPIADVIQTSAPVNPGNSGGPLLNTLGEVVGITTALIQDSQGLGFAIPSDTILRELPYLTRGLSYPHPWMGVTGVDVDFDVAQAIGLNVTYGWLIESVTAGGPAANAGIRAGQQSMTVGGIDYVVGGDVIISIDGSRIRNGDDLSSYMAKNTVAGQAIQVTILRSGQKITLPVTLGTRPTV